MLLVSHTPIPSTAAICGYDAWDEYTGDDCWKQSPCWKEPVVLVIATQTVWAEALSGSRAGVTQEARVIRRFFGAPTGDLYGVG